MAKSDGFCNRAEAYEAHDDRPLSPDGGETIGDVIVRRYSRRDMMRGTLGVAAATVLFGPSALAAREASATGIEGDRFDFEEVTAGVDGTHHVAPGIARKFCFAGAIRCSPSHPPSIRCGRVLPHS